MVITILCIFAIYYALSLTPPNPCYILCIICIIRSIITNIPRKKFPIILEPEEAQNLLKQPNKRYPTGLRNKAIMSLMLHCGLRVSEVTNLRPGNINLTKGKLRVENGKGNKDRDLAIPEYLIDLLNNWRKKRIESTYFFSTLKGKKLSIRYLQQMVKRYGQKAGINKRISPHTLCQTVL